MAAAANTNLLTPDSQLNHHHRGITVITNNNDSTPGASFRIVVEATSGAANSGGQSTHAPLSFNLVVAPEPSDTGDTIGDPLLGNRVHSENDNAISGRFTRWVFIGVLISQIIGAVSYTGLAWWIGMLFRKDGFTKPCDRYLRVWCTTWLALTLGQSYGNLLLPLIPKSEPVVKWLNILSAPRGVVWLLLGVYPVFVQTSCSEESALAGRVIWWGQFTVSVAIPCVFLILLCATIPLWHPLLVSLLRPEETRPVSEADLQKVKKMSYGSLRQLIVTTFGERGQHAPPVISRPGTPAATPNGPLKIGGLLGLPSGLLQSALDNARITNGAASTLTAGDEHEISATTTALEQCAICHEDFTDNEILAVLPCDIRHFFHEDCVFQWLRRTRACPICRADIVQLLKNADRAEADTAIGAGAS